jgi:hypothetical protein
VERIAPAFPRYVFLFLERLWHWRFLDNTHLNYTLLANETGLSTIRDSEVERVKTMEMSGRLDSLPRDLALDFWRGQIRMVTDASLSLVDQFVTVEETPHPGDLTVAVSFGGIRIPAMSLSSMTITQV